MGDLNIPEEEPYVPLKITMRTRTAATIMKGVSVDGNVMELISPMSARSHKPVVPSVIPKPYIPPTFRHGLTSRESNKNIEKTQENPNMMKTDLDIFNSNISDNISNSDRRIKPIEKAELRKTTGTFGRTMKSMSLIETTKDIVRKKLPRQKNEKPVKNSKLPPPPLGASIGHGIFQI